MLEIAARRPRMAVRGGDGRAYRRPRRVNSRICGESEGVLMATYNGLRRVAGDQP